MTLNRAADFPVGGLLVIGDSRVERLHIPELCRLPVFNAGLSSARSDQVRPMVPDLVERLQPRHVVVALGANDIAQRRAGWHADLAALTPRGAIIVGITGADDANRFLARLAAERGGIFVAPLAAEMTSDGVHANTAGRAEWKIRVNRACANLPPIGQPPNGAHRAAPPASGLDSRLP